MPYLETFRERADEPFLPAEPEEETVVEKQAPKPAADATAPLETKSVSEQTAPLKTTPTPTYDSSDLEKALAALDSKTLVRQSVEQGALEAQKAVEAAVRADVDISPEEVLDYLGGRARKPEVVQLLSKPVMDVSKAQAPKGKTGELEADAQVKTVRPYADVVVDVFDAALKGQYVKQATEGLEDEEARKEAAAAAKAKYRADMEKFREGLVRDGEAPSLRRTKEHLATMYSGSLAPNANINVLEVAAREGAGDAVQLFQKGLFEKADPTAGGVIRRAIETSLFEDEDERGVRRREEVQGLASDTYERLVKRSLFDPTVKPDLGGRVNLILGAGRVRQVAPVETTSMSADALRVGEMLNLPAQTVMGIMSAESGGNAQARAFNLHRLMRDPAMTDEKREQAYAALARVGFNADEAKIAIDDGELVPFMGKAGERALDAVFDIEPAAATRATAWGLFQVMGREGDAVGLMKQVAKEQGGRDLTDDQAARALYNIFKTGKGATEISNALLVNWFRGNPEAYRTAQSLGSTDEVRALARLYVGGHAGGQSQREAWERNFTKGYAAYSGTDLTQVEPGESQQEFDPSEAALREQEVRAEESGIIGGGTRAENLFGLVADVALPGSAKQTYEQEAEAAKKGMNFVQVASDAFGSNDRLYLPEPGTEKNLVAVAALKEWQNETGLDIQNYATLGMGRGFSRLQQEVRSNALQAAKREADRQGLTGDAREKYLEEAQAEASRRATLAATSAQTAGLWLNPIITSMREATGIGGETLLDGAPEFLRSYAEALAPKIELLGRNGDELIYRQEGGGQALLSTLDAAPGIGQAFNVGVINNYIVPNLEALGLDREEAQAVSPFVATAMAMATPVVGPMLTLGGQADDIYYAGVAGVGDREELVQYGMETLSAQAGVAAELATPLLDWMDEKDYLSWVAPTNVTGSEERVVAVKDTIRSAGAIAGMGVGLLAAVLHPDLLGGAASGARGVSAAGRALRATGVTDSLRDSVHGMRFDIWGKAVDRQAATLELFGRNDVAADFVSDADTVQTMLDETREAVVASLRSADEYDEGFRVGHEAAAKEVDQNQAAMLGRMAADGNVGAQAALDAAVSRRVSSIIEVSIEAAKVGDDPVRAAKAAELEEVIKSSGMAGRLDLLILSPSMTDLASKTSQTAGVAFGSADRADILLRALEIVDDVELTMEPRLQLLAKNLSGTPVESFNGKPITAFGATEGRVVTVSPSGESDLLSLFGLVEPEAFEGSLKNVRKRGSKSADEVRGEMRAQYEAVREFIEDFRATVTSDEVLDEETMGLFVARALEIGLSDTNYRMLRNSTPNTGGKNLQKVVQTVLNEAKAAREASSVTQVLQMGLAAVGVSSLTRAEALKDLARSRVGQMPPEAIDSFLDTQGKGARTQRVMAAVKAGTVEGVTTLLQGTPFFGRMFGGDVGTYQARMARQHLARADGSDPDSVAHALQRETAGRLRARLAAMTEDLEDEALDTMLRSETYGVLKKQLARVETPEWRAGFVSWLHRASEQRRSGQEVEVFEDLPVGIDMGVFQKFGRRSRASKATRRFLERTNFFDAFGFAGEQEQRTRAFSQKTRTRKKKINRKEQRTLALLIDQMAKGAAGVTDEMRPAEVEQRLTAFYDNVLNVQRTVSTKKYQSALEEAALSVETEYQRRLTEALRDIVEPVSADTPPGSLVTEVGPDGNLAGSWYTLDSMAGTEGRLRPLGAAGGERPARVTRPLDGLRVLPEEQHDSLRQVAAQARFDAIEAVVDVVDENTGRALREMADADGGLGGDALLQEVTKGTRDVFEVLAGSESTPPTKYSILGGDPEDYDVALGADDVDEADALFSEVGINYSGKLREIVYDESGKAVAASAIGRRDEGELSFDVVVSDEARRQGLARTLVERILQDNPGETYRVWVVNEHMARLLEDIGFETAVGGWRQDDPHMTLVAPTQKQAREKLIERARYRATAAERAEAAALAAQNGADRYVLRFLASAVKANSIPAEEVTSTALAYMDPRRFEDAQFRAVVWRRVQSGDIKFLTRRSRKLRVPLSANGVVDEDLLRARAAAYDQDIARGSRLLESGVTPEMPLFQKQEGGDALLQEASSAGAQGADEVAEARRLWEERGTESPYFKRWFGESKVVDDEGQPLVVYKGTTRIVDENYRPTGGLEVRRAVFFSDNADVAEPYRYPREYGEFLYERYDEASGEYVEVAPGTLIEAYISMKNPLVLVGEEAQKFTDDAGRQSRAVARAKSEGFDGIIAKNVVEDEEVGTTYVVFDPSQIKSVHNRGTFDSDDARILYQKKDAPSDDLGRARGHTLDTAVEAGEYREARATYEGQDLADLAAEVSRRGIDVPAAESDKDALVSALLRDEFGGSVPRPTEVGAAGALASAEATRLEGLRRLLVEPALPRTPPKSPDAPGGAETPSAPPGRAPGQTPPSASPAGVDEDAKGMVRFVDDARAIITAFKSADASTGLHELSHVARRQLGDAQQQVILDWVNATLAKQGKAPVTIRITESGARLYTSADKASVVAAEEMFARGFERYLREGVVPTSSLRSAFRTMKKVLSRIYVTVFGSDIDVDVSPEMYNLFDEMFGAKRQVTLDDVTDTARFLDAQAELRRAGEAAREGREGAPRSRYTGADRTVESGVNERTFIDSVRQWRASVEDYHSRGVGFLAPDRGTSVKAAAEAGRTVGPGSRGTSRIDQTAIGPVSRRRMSPEEIVAARRGDADALAKFKRLSVADKIVVDAAWMATTWTRLTLFGDDHARAFRAINPTLRTMLRGAEREFEEMTSELSLLIRDVAMTSGPARAAAESRVISYLCGPDGFLENRPLLVTGARRGQKARQNFVNTSRALSDLLDDFFGMMSEGSLDALTNDAEFVLHTLAGVDAGGVRSGERGALDAFWRGLTVAPEGKKTDAVVDGGLIVSDEVVEKLAVGADGKVSKSNLSELQTDLLKSIYTALTGEPEALAGKVDAGARNLAALMAFVTGNAGVTKDGVRLTIDDLVASDGRVMDHSTRLLHFLYYGGELRREGVSAVVPGIRTGAADDILESQQFSTLLAMGTAGYAAGVLKDYALLGRAVSPRDMRAYNMYQAGRADLLSPAEIERAIEIADQYGFTKFALSPLATGGVYIPSDVRAGMVKQLQQAQRQMGQTAAKVSATEEFLRRSAGWILSGIIFGTVIGRQAFKLMSTQDLGYQLGLVAGGPAGVAATARASALTLLTAVGGERAAELTEEVVRGAAKVAPGEAVDDFVKNFAGGDAESFKMALRRASITKMDDIVRAATEFLGTSKFRVEVAPIMDNQDAVFVLGGSAYNARDLRREFTRAGLYSNAYKEVRFLLTRDFSRQGEAAAVREMRQEDVERMLSENGASAANIGFFRSMVETPGDASASAWRAAKRGGSTIFEYGLESADAWSDLERTGGAVTLIEQGMRPYDAAKVMVEAVYDYRGSMGEGDRAWWRKLLMPFWAFRKNANIQFANLAADPSTAFRMMALSRATRWAPQALTYALYETFLEPYDVNVDGMSGSQRDLYYNLRAHLEYGYGDEVTPEVLESYRGLLPEEQRDMSDADLLDHDFDGWTIREGFKGYPGVPQEMKLVMRALIAGRGNALTRKDGGIYDLRTTIVNRNARDRYVQMGQDVYVQQGPHQGGLPSWAAKRPNVQFPIPVLDEYAQQVHAMTRLNEAGRENVAGLSFYFVLPDNFIMAASDMAAASIIAPVAIAAALDPDSSVDKTMVINALEALVDVRGFGSPLGQVGMEITKALTNEDAAKMGRVRLHPLMARALEGSIGVPVPAEGGTENRPGTSFFHKSLMRMAQVGAHAGAMGTTAGYEVFAGEDTGSMRTFSRPRDFSVEVDPETGERAVAPKDRPLSQEYVNKRDEMYAYQPYLYGPAAALFPNTEAGRINRWLLANFDDSSPEAALKSGESFRNFLLAMVIETARQAGTRVMAEDPELTAIIDKPRK